MTQGIQNFGDKVYDWTKTKYQEEQANKRARMAMWGGIGSSTIGAAGNVVSGGLAGGWGERLD